MAGTVFTFGKREILDVELITRPVNLEVFQGW